MQATPDHVLLLVQNIISGKQNWLLYRNITSVKKKKTLRFVGIREIPHTKFKAQKNCSLDRSLQNSS